MDARQQQEIEALQAIYGSDFLLDRDSGKRRAWGAWHSAVRADPVWKVPGAQRAFKLHLCPVEPELKSHVSVYLVVRCGQAGRTPWGNLRHFVPE